MLTHNGVAACPFVESETCILITGNDIVTPLAFSNA